MCKSASSYEYARYFAGKYQAFMDVLSYLEGHEESTEADVVDGLSIEEALTLHGYREGASFKHENGDLIISKTPGTRKVVEEYGQEKGKDPGWYFQIYTDPITGMPMYRLKKAVHAAAM